MAYIMQPYVLNKDGLFLQCKRCWDQGARFVNGISEQHYFVRN